MALYQGEDIVISITIDNITNLIDNNFVMLLVSSSNDDETYTFQWDAFDKDAAKNRYSITISSLITSGMLGLYDIEIKFINSEGNQSIFTKEKALFIEKSRIKDIEIKTN